MIRGLFLWLTMLGFTIHPAPALDTGPEGAPVKGSAEPVVADDEDEEADDAPKAVKVGRSRMEFYGFVRLDAIFDDSRPNHPQFPTFILSEDPAVGSKDNASSNLHPRLTRLGVNVKGPTVKALGGASLSGKIEIDFQNGGRESREVIRMRHGWFKISWENHWSLLAGQTWDTFSPLYPTVNSDSLMWNTGNLGDRRPQLLVAYEPESGPVSFAGGIGLTGAIDSQDLDGDGVRDGDDSSLPNFQARIGFSGPGFRLGVSGHYGTEQTDAPIAGENDFDSYSANLDYDVSLGGGVSWKGEVWTGRNLSDFRGGIGQGVNTTTGREIDSSGGWSELGFKITEVYSLYVGYTMDNPPDEDIPAGGRIENRAAYLVNRFRFGQPFMLGIDYLNWTTEYKGLEKGTDNRFNLYLVYNF